MRGVGRVILMNGTTSQLAGVAKEARRCAIAQRWPTPPHPLPPDYLRTLLIIKTRTKNRGLYPTMCMIISYLVEDSQKRPLIFQRDRLWINPKARKSVRRTHDVCNSKRLNTKIREIKPLYSIRYTEKNSENGASWCPEPTMSMNTKSVAVSGAKASCSYVVEIKARSALAPQGRCSLTHDVHEDRRINLKGRPWICRRRQEIASLYVASSLGGLCLSGCFRTTPGDWYSGGVRSKRPLTRPDKSAPSRRGLGTHPLPWERAVVGFVCPLPWGEGGEPVRSSAANGPEPVRLRFNRPERSEGAQGKLSEPGEGS